MRAGPAFLSQFTTRTSLQRERVERALFWKGSRLLVRGRLLRMRLRILALNVVRCSCMVTGMYHSFRSQSDPTCILGLYGSSVIGFGRPAKKTLVRRYFWNRANEAVGFLFGKRGVG